MPTTVMIDDEIYKLIIKKQIDIYNVMEIKKSIKHIVNEAILMGIDGVDCYEMDSFLNIDKRQDNQNDKHEESDD